jgi:hypothetical protein
LPSNGRPSIVACLYVAGLFIELLPRNGSMRHNNMLGNSWLQYVRFMVDKAALRQVFSQYFGFPCQSFHQFLQHHNHPGLAQ